MHGCASTNELIMRKYMYHIRTKNQLGSLTYNELMCDRVISSNHAWVARILNLPHNRWNMLTRVDSDVPLG
jgi:hypothetical protein